MLWRIRETEGSPALLGNKGAFLCQMRGQGFPVPDGVILDKEEYKAFIRYHGIDGEIESLLAGLERENVQKTGARLRALFDGRVLPEKTVRELSARLSGEGRYAVRSSGTMEDLEAHSFAGQYDTFLNITAEELARAVVQCYRSLFSDTILSYMADRGLGFSGYAMSVIVQEMVPAEYSGVCFTVDPVTGDDKTMLIEVAAGLGEALVSGRVAPERYAYNWYEKAGTGGGRALAVEQVERFGAVFADIQLFFGYPCDIEFAIAKGELFILQARRITKLNYGGLRDLWSTADFKDGGVSAAVCHPFMWSLYEYVWEYSLRKFLLDSRILKEGELRKLGEMFYARCYWNLSVVKLAMSKVIGYREREFDSEYGIRITYQGDGQVTKPSLLSLAHIIRMALAQRRILKARNAGADGLKQTLLAQYERYLSEIRDGRVPDIETAWFRLTHDDYLQSETTYFWQIFINTIHQALYKSGLLRYVTESEYLTLLGSIEDISHLLPFYAMWELSRRIRENPEAFAYWRETPPGQIVQDIREGGKNCLAAEVSALAETYGYHSDKELDVSYPNYFEDMTPLVANIRDMTALSDAYSPQEDRRRGREKNLAILEKIQKKTRARQFRKIKTKVENMRRMLWWREEFRDISTRFYCLIRMYTLAYAQHLTEKGVLSCPEDIWFLKVEDLWAYRRGERTIGELEDLVAKNRRYYGSYRNYMSENEIGAAFGGAASGDGKALEGQIKGLGANSGRVTGTARVIEDFSEIGRLREKDILVTKFTDTGWTPKFAILSGIVTEYGGILCHAAIVSREYGIPAIVNCSDAMKKIRDGQRITIDGATGLVTVEEGEGKA